MELEKELDSSIPIDEEVEIEPDFSGDEKVIKFARVRKCHVCGSNCVDSCTRCEKRYEGLKASISPYRPQFGRRALRRQQMERLRRKFIGEIITPPCEVSFATILETLEALVEHRIADPEELFAIQKKYQKSIERSACPLCDTRPVPPFEYCLNCNGVFRSTICDVTTGQLDEQSKQEQIRSVCQPPYVIPFQSIFEVLDVIRGSKKGSLTPQQFASLTRTLRR